MIQPTSAQSAAYRIATVVFLAVLMCAVESTAELSYPSDQQSETQQVQGMQKLMGTIKKTEKVGANDRNQQNLVVQLKTQEQEKNITVDLGNVEQLKDMDIQVGNRIIVWGRLVTKDDGHLFMAHRLWIAGGTIDIERQPSQQQANEQGQRDE